MCEACATRAAESLCRNPHYGPESLREISSAVHVETEHHRRCTESTSGAPAMPPLSTSGRQACRMLSRSCAVIAHPRNACFRTYEPVSLPRARLHAYDRQRHVLPLATLLSVSGSRPTSSCRQVCASAASPEPRSADDGKAQSCQAEYIDGVYIWYNSRC